VFEGARLITRDGSAPTEDAAFVVANSRITAVGRRGEVTAPAGAAHIDLSGKDRDADQLAKWSADFIVLDANPLDNIANVRKINAVYLRGEAVDRAGLRAKWQAQWREKGQL